MNPFSSAVNQKLFLAKLLLKQISVADDKFGHLEMALSQSAIFQMMCAYELYLNEIAHNYQAEQSKPISNVAELCQALVNADKHPSEAAEIQQLERQGDSWLADLFIAYQSIKQPQSLALEDKSNLIPSLRIGGKKEVPVNAKQVSYFLTNFDELLERHRGLMIES